MRRIIPGGPTGGKVQVQPIAARLPPGLAEKPLASGEVLIEPVATVHCASRRLSIKSHAAFVVRRESEDRTAEKPAGSVAGPELALEPVIVFNPLQLIDFGAASSAVPERGRDGRRPSGRARRPHNASTRGSFLVPRIVRLSRRSPGRPGPAARAGSPGENGRGPAVSFPIGGRDSSVPPTGKTRDREAGRSCPADHSPDPANHSSRTKPSRRSPPYMIASRGLPRLPSTTVTYEGGATLSTSARNEPWHWTLEL